MILFLEAFHFLRPGFLALTPVILWLWWRVRAMGRDRGISGGDRIAPHLRAALTVGAMGARRIRPIDGVMVTLLLVTLGAAGPSWTRQSDPFAAQSAPAVVVLAVTEAMLGTDVQPSRLERGKQKIRDVLDLRAGGRTALVAYAGSAHVVLPMTEDPQVMTPYLNGLSPEIMPRPGNTAGPALELAQAILAAQDAPGGILWVTDGIDPADTSALNATEVPLAVLSMRPEGSPDRGLDALTAPVIAVTPDAADVRRIDRLLNAAYRRAQLQDSDQPWEDRGVWLAWPAAVLMLVWFRRGWTMRWTVAVLLCGALTLPGTARAGVADWFLTADQQGRLAFDKRDYARAAALFADPLWRGYALYKSGQYKEVVPVLDRVETAQAAAIQGMAQVKSRAYREAIASFETALARDADYPGAAENLAMARRILEFVEEAREQSDTGEDRGIGADEMVFDNTSARGEDTQIEVAEEGAGLMSAEQWMNTVDTRTSDFLRLRFALELADGQGAAADPEAE